MKILFLSPLVPYPLIDGDRQRAFHLLQALAAKHTVHFLGFLRHPAEEKHLASLRRFCASAAGVFISRPQLLANCLRAWPTSVPLNVAAFHSTAMQEAVARTMREKRIDCVHAYRLRMAPYALRAAAECRILDYTDALTRQFQNRTLVQRGWWRQWYNQHEWRRLRRYEPEVSHGFTASCISSALDRGQLLSLGADKTLIEITNGVNTRSIRAVSRLTSKPTLLFVGNLAYEPNLWGLQRFCQETWPLIRRQDRRVRLLVVGQAPDRLAQDPILRQSGVHFAGVVSSLQPYFARTRVAICPLEVASGRQFKVIEYFAAGLPTVASPVVAANLGAQSGRHCLVAKTPRAFAESVLSLCQDNRLAERLRRAGRTLAVKKYDWNHAAGRLLALYRRLERKPGSRRKA
ncbi:glycosyltransferase [candidate division FCPU426 bacterium]|nr:glycosyltransferase [candidate division FCPU426 bacterium]